MKPILAHTVDNLEEYFEDCWTLFSAKTGVKMKSRILVKNIRVLNSLIGRMSVNYNHVFQVVIH